MNEQTIQKLHAIALQMKTLTEEGDEEGHEAADKLLLEALRLLAAGTAQESLIAQIKTAFEALPKWYA